MSEKMQPAVGETAGGGVNGGAANASFHSKNTTNAAPRQAPVRADGDEIRRALAVLFPPGDVCELRIPEAGKDKTVAGYFNDHELLVKAAMVWSGKAAAVYVTLNPVLPELLARACNRVITYAKVATTDTQILKRRWLLVDPDPSRVGGISSTEQQHAAALSLAQYIRADLTMLGWPLPLLADSGNGAHLLYRVDLPVDDGGLIQRVLQALARTYDGDGLTIDKGVFNPARICKLYGTPVCKGDNLPDRPHRIARILDLPDVLEPVSSELLQALAGPKPAPRAQSARPTASTFDLAAWIAQHIPGARGPVDTPTKDGQGRKWVFQCPWRPDDGDAAFILQMAGGAIAAGCQHDTCPGAHSTGNHWRELRALLDPDYSPERKESKGPRTIEEHEQGLQDIGCALRLNRVTGMLENNGQPLDDPELRTIRVKMRDAGFTYTLAFEDSLWYLAKLHEYHPIRAYLVDCGAAYDGQTHIAGLAGHFTDVTLPHPLFATWLRRWLIGAVAKALRSGDVHNSMLVLDGPQLIGKSFFASWLASGLPGYFTRGRVDPEQKDSHLRYGENFIWETAELGATTRRADVDALKEFISAETVTVRRPYDKYDTKRPALASLIGTINNSAGFLADTTGNRRFLVSHISTIDWAYSQQVDVRQVWGEAFTAFQQGEPWLPTSKELVLSEENNSTYMLPCPLEGYLDRYFDIDPSGNNWESTGDIVAHLTFYGYKAAGSRALSMEVASALASIGCKKYRKETLHGQMWGYLGISRRAVRESKKDADASE